MNVIMIWVEGGLFMESGSSKIKILRQINIQNGKWKCVNNGSTGYEKIFKWLPAYHLQQLFESRKIKIFHFSHSNLLLPFSIKSNHTFLFTHFPKIPIIFIIAFSIIIAMTEKSKIENYLEAKVNPILEELLTSIIKTRPKNVLNYCRGWIEKKAETVQIQPESQSDSEDQESRVSELQEYKGRNKWYEHRKGICAEVYGNHHLWEQCDMSVVSKKSTVNSRILFRLKSLFLFKDFDDNEITRLIGAMSEVACAPGAMVIKEGQTGSDMFVVDSGELQVIKGGAGEESILKVIRQGEMFGENSMLYNTPRWASIRAKTACMLFRLERKTYHSLTTDRNLRKRKIFQNSLQKIDILRELEIQEKYKLQDLIQEIPVHQNQYIIRQGKVNKKFYIVESGKYVSLKTEKSGHDRIVSQFKEGDIFGQFCLVSKKPAAESIMSLTNGKIYGIQREGLERVLGSISKILKRSIDVYQKYKNYDM